MVTARTTPANRAPCVTHNHSPMPNPAPSNRAVLSCDSRVRRSIEGDSMAGTHFLSVYSHTTRTKKISTAQQRQCLGVVVAPDRLLLESHAAKSEPHHLLDEFLPRDAIVHDGLGRHQVEHDHNDQVMREP